MITMKEVAKKAGVSVATVSHVLNNTHFVSDKLKSIVQKTIKELDYSPDLIAGSLRKRKTNTIGLIIPENNNPFFAELAMKIENTGFLSGYSVIICYTSYDFKKEISYLKVLKSKKVDGLIIVPSTEDPTYINQLAENNLPVIVINRFLDKINTSMVYLNGYKGMFDMTKYILELGHKRISYIDRPYKLPHSVHRIKGFKDALKQHEIKFKQDMLLRTTFGIEGGVLGAKELLKKKTLPTAIICFNDLLAIGVMWELNRKKIRIPEDISVTGFDNIAYSGFTTPTLTTIHSPIEEMVKTSFSLLKEKIDKKNSSINNRNIILEPKLIVRESTCRIEKYL
jgi:LacI family transcriptional regulator